MSSNLNVKYHNVMASIVVQVNYCQKNIETIKNQTLEVDPLKPYAMTLIPKLSQLQTFDNRRPS